MGYCQKSYCVFHESVPLYVYTFITIVIVDNLMRCIFLFINQSYVLEDVLGV